MASSDNFSLSEYAGMGPRATARQSGQPAAGAGTVLVTLSVAHATSTVLTAGHYMVVATVPCWIRLTTLASVVAAQVDKDYYLPANLPMMLRLGSDNSGSSGTTYDSVDAIAGGAGKLYLTKMIP